MNKDQFKEYADLMVEKRRLEARLEELKPLLQEQIVSSGADKVETEFGNFTISSRTTWKYSEAVSQLQEKEKAIGIAKKVESMSLIYKEAKSKEIVND